MKTMTNLLLALLVTVVCILPAQAKEFAGITLPDTYPLNGTELRFNGAGLREKFFIDVYAGALYTPAPVKTAAEVFAADMPKVIRMHFIYKEVEAEKIVEAFVDGIKGNTPSFAGTPAAEAFLKLFTFPLKKGDTLDLQFSSSGGLAVVYNEKTLQSFTDPALAQAVLGIYFGKKPIKGLADGMLGK